MHNVLSRYYDEIKQIEQKVNVNEGRIDAHVVALKVVKGRMVADMVAMAGAKKKSNEDYIMIASLDDMVKTLDGMLSGLESRVLEKPSAKAEEEPTDAYINVRPFDDFQPTLLLFYSTKCGYCHQFKPIWAELKRIYANRSINMLAIRGDSAPPEAMQYIKQFQITGYPTLVLIEPNSNKKYEFKGERTLNNLLHFIESNVP